MISLRGLRVEGERKLVIPAEFKAGLTHGIVPGACAWMPFGDIRGMRRNFIGNDACLYIIAVGQSQVLLRRDIAQHGCTTHCDMGGTDGGSDVIIARGDIGN